MAEVSLPYTLSNGTANDATQVQANFTALANAISDGTMDVQVAGITGTTLTLSGAATITGDIKSVALTSLALTSLVGWSGTPTGFIKYKKVGKLVYLFVKLSGTSNAATVSFSVPYAPAAAGTPDFYNPVYTTDGTTTYAIGLMYVDNATAKCIALRNAAGDDWTATGTKQVYGQIVYEASV